MWNSVTQQRFTAWILNVRLHALALWYTMIQTESLQGYLEAQPRCSTKSGVSCTGFRATAISASNSAIIDSRYESTSP